jgi:anti-anti-sigma factor
MQASAFEATVHDEERRALIRLEGDLDGNARERLAAAYEEAAVLQPSFIVLDFTQVGYINSTGIAAIVGVLARARADKRDMSAFGLSDHYREIFQITRLADFVHIYPNEESALAASATS